jgi:hypothetical protein
MTVKTGANILDDDDNNAGDDVATNNNTSPLPNLNIS